jgi:hypothetical protein
MNRETKPLTTPGGHKVVLYTYLTARETLPLLSDEKLSTQQKSQKLAVTAIFSLDGSPDDIENRILDLTLPDYTFLLTQTKDLIDGGFPTAK